MLWSCKVNIGNWRGDAVSAHSERVVALAPQPTVSSDGQKLAIEISTSNDASNMNQIMMPFLPIPHFKARLSPPIPSPHRLSALPTQCHANPRLMVIIGLCSPSCVPLLSRLQILTSDRVRVSRICIPYPPTRQGRQTGLRRTFGLDLNPAGF